MVKINITTEKEHSQIAADFARSQNIEVQSVDVALDGRHTTSFNVGDTPNDIREVSRNFAQFFLDRAVPDDRKNYYDMRETHFDAGVAGIQVGKNQFLMLEKNENAVDLSVREIALEAH